MSIPIGIYILCGVIVITALTTVRFYVIFMRRGRLIYERGIEKLIDYPGYLEMAIDLRKWKYKQFFGE